MVTKIEKVRRRLRKIIPEWMKRDGRPPNREEFLTEYRLREELSHPQYSTAKKQVMLELGYEEVNNTAEQVKQAKSIAQLNKEGETAINKKLEQAVKHLLPVMEKDRLEEVTVTFDPDTGEVQYEFQAAPPPRQKVTLRS